MAEIIKVLLVETLYDVIDEKIIPFTRIIYEKNKEIFIGSYVPVNINTSRSEIQYTPYDIQGEIRKLLDQD